MNEPFTNNKIDEMNGFAKVSSIKEQQKKPTNI